MTIPVTQYFWGVTKVPAGKPLIIGRVISRESSKQFLNPSPIACFAPTFADDALNLKFRQLFEIRACEALGGSGSKGTIGGNVRFEMSDIENGV